MKVYEHSIEEVCEYLKTDVKKGLSYDEIAIRQKKYGLNKLEQAKKKTNLQKFLDEFKDAMIIILLIAAAISFVLAFNENASTVGSWYEVNTL